LIPTVLTLLLAATAQAAEVTDMPPALRGDVSLSYAGSIQAGSLDEDGGPYGRRRLERHDLALQVEFALAAGVAVRIALPYTPVLRQDFSGATEMTYDPVTASGTYTAEVPLDHALEVRARGMDGVWLGAAVTPFSEARNPRQQVTWRLDAAFRTASPEHSYWTVSGGKRGVSPGGLAWALGAAFSTETDFANPYLTMGWVREGAVTVDVVDDDGDTWASGLEVRPASTVDVSAGVELVAHRDGDERVAVDLLVGFGYRTWEDVPSGLYLPSVLDASRSQLVTRGEHLVASTGLGLVYHVNQYAGVRLGAEVRYFQPHRLEHVYPVSTGLDTWEMSWSARVVGRVR